jgi:hypothetical protein
MNPKNNSRASELGDLLLSGTTGFTVRKRTGVGLFFHIFMLIVLAILGAAMIVYYDSVEGSALAMGIGISLTVIAHNLEKIKKVKQALEFMNALFSSALGRGYQFCFVVKNTGDIIFYNRPFQTLFPAYIAQNTRTLDSLMGLYNLPQDHREQIKNLITSALEGTVATSVRDNTENTTQAMTFYLEPIERPTGFMLVRGK